MARIFGFLIAFLIVAYGIWPYYTVYRLDTALADDDPNAIAPFVDLNAIRADYKQQIGSKVATISPAGQGESDVLTGWLTSKLQGLGNQAVDQVVDLAWVQHLLREAATRATTERPAYFLTGVEYAFYRSWNQFLVRLGPKQSPTRILFRLEGFDWQIIQVSQ